MRTEYTLPEPGEDFYEEVFLATGNTTGVLDLKAVVNATLLVQQNAQIREAVNYAYTCDELRFVKNTVPGDIQPGDYLNLSPEGKTKPDQFNVFLYLGEDVFFDGYLTFDRATLYDIARECECKITVYEPIS